MEIKIEPFTIDLYDSALALWKRSEGIGISKADSREAIEAYLERNRGMSFVALQNEQLVGTVLCGHDGRRGYIHHMAVDNDFRKLGIGRRLEESCLLALKQEKIEKCHIFIYKENKEGQIFWNKLGWTDRDSLMVGSKLVD